MRFQDKVIGEKKKNPTILYNFKQFIAFYGAFFVQEKRVHQSNLQCYVVHFIIFENKVIQLKNA